MQNVFKDRDPAEKMAQYAESAQQKIRQGQEQLGRLVNDVDEQLHKNPWPVVAGVAVGCLFLGFIMGSKARS